jgi:tRNA modification GTPase
LDYAEDEIEEEGRAHLPDRPKAEDALSRLRALSRSYQRERLYQEGALVVIAGKPNAGKSSLFNFLLREDRSIVADVPGTTRDWIEGWISLEGIPIRLADTAGLRDSGDCIEEAGVGRTRELLSRADAALYLIDGTCGISPEDAAFLAGSPEVIGVWNKIDEAPLLQNSSLLGISAKTGQGIGELACALTARVAGFPQGWEQESAGIATERQKAGIDAAAAHIAEGLLLADKQAPLDLIAPLFREGINALGELTGEVSTLEILEVMFSAFCVGK